MVALSVVGEDLVEVKLEPIKEGGGVGCSVYLDTSRVPVGVVHLYYERLTQVFTYLEC